MNRTPLTRRTALKRTSKKRAALNRKVGPQREAMKLDAGECMICLKQLPPDKLDCDEIARGHAREACLDEPLLILVSCRACHRKTQDWPIAKRIAARVRWTIRRSCQRYNDLRGTAQTHVVPEEVNVYLLFNKRGKKRK